MDECTKIFYQRVNKLNGHLGASIYDVGNIFGIYDPLVTVTNQMILFLSSAFWGHPSPNPLRKSYMEAPLLRESVWPRGKIPVKKSPIVWRMHSVHNDYFWREQSTECKHRRLSHKMHPFALALIFGCSFALGTAQGNLTNNCLSENKNYI